MPVLVALLAIATVVVFASDTLRSFFVLTRLATVDIVIVLAITAVWGYAMRAIWRQRLLSRMFGLERPPVSRRA